MTVTDHGPWLLRGDRPMWTPAVPAGLEYHRVYATEKRRILRGIVAIVLLVAGFIGFAVLFQRLSEVVDAALFARSGPSTPLRQAAGALALTALVPYSMLVQRVLYGVTFLVLATTLHVDVGAELAARSEAVGSWANLVPSAALVVITAIVWWMTRRTGPARTPRNGGPDTRYARRRTGGRHARRHDIGRAVTPRRNRRRRATRHIAADRGEGQEP